MRFPFLLFSLLFYLELCFFPLSPCIDLAEDVSGNVTSLLIRYRLPNHPSFSITQPSSIDRPASNRPAAAALPSLPLLLFVQEYIQQRTRWIIIIEPQFLSFYQGALFHHFFRRCDARLARGSGLVDLVTMHHHQGPSATFNNQKSGRKMTSIKSFSFLFFRP